MTRFRWLLGDEPARPGLAHRAQPRLAPAHGHRDRVRGRRPELPAHRGQLVRDRPARRSPLINTGLTYDYQRAGQESADDAIATALDETARESGTAYDPATRCSWQQLPATGLPGSSVPAVARLLSVPGACQHVALVGRCPSSPGEIAVLKADATTYGWSLGSRITPARVPDDVPGRRHLHAASRDDAFWFGPRLQTAPGRLSRSCPVALAPWFTTQAGIELTATRGSSPSTRRSTSPRT